MDRFGILGCRPSPSFFLCLRFRLCVSVSVFLCVSRASFVPSGYREGVACCIKAMEIQCEKKKSNYFFFQKLLITLPSLSFLSLDIMIYDL